MKSSASQKLHSDLDEIDRLQIESLEKHGCVVRIPRRIVLPKNVCDGLEDRCLVMRCEVANMALFLVKRCPLKNAIGPRRNPCAAKG